jgi:hypothetical protein
MEKQDFGAVCHSTKGKPALAAATIEARFLD